MEIFIYAVVALLIGLAVGFFIGRSANSGSSATIAELRTQIDSANRERLEREAREEKENKLLRELEPVKKNLDEMREAVTAMERERIAHLTELKTAMKANLESDELLRKQTQQLSNALSNNSVRGVWGETQLRRLVELAGLVKHADFDQQVAITTGRADMIISLPDSKQLVIDSKVPYNKYQEAVEISVLAEGAEKDRRAALMKEHVKAVKSHIDDLASRAYWDGLDISPDFVVMFIPSEALLSASLDADPTLMEYAFQKNVALASPVSLYSVLKTINYIWRQNVDESQLRKLIGLGKELYERVDVIARAVGTLGKSLGNTVKDFNTFVASFESRFLVTARKLNNLDENELSTHVIEEPKAIEEQPKNFTSPEALEGDSEG